MTWSDNRSCSSQPNGPRIILCRQIPRRRCRCCRLSGLQFEFWDFSGVFFARGKGVCLVGTMMNFTRLLLFTALLCVTGCDKKPGESKAQLLGRLREDFAEVE